MLTDHASLSMLRHYLTVLLGHRAEADRCLSRMLHGGTALPQRIDADVRVQLLRRARALAAGFAPPSPCALSALPWMHRSPLPDGVAMERLRSELGASSREALFLRFALELAETDIARVLGMDMLVIEVTLDRALREAQSLARGASLPLGRLLAAAFALDLAAREGEGDDPDLAAVGELVGGRYKALRRVGSGASAQVFQAEDHEVAGHVVALKLMRQPVSDEAHARITRHELQVLASVWHPSVVQFKSSGIHNGRIFLTMPWLDGETLAARLARTPDGLDRVSARRIFESLARAVAALHRVGVRHQDIKAENVFLARVPGIGEELPVLLDLGVAVRSAEFFPAGTPAYMAPEVARNFLVGIAGPEGCVPTDSALDVYSLCLTLLEALCPDGLERPAMDDAVTFRDFLERRVAGELPKLDDPRLTGLRACFARWLARDPKTRPSADVLADELKALTARSERSARMQWLGTRIALPSLLALALSAASINHAFAVQQGDFERMVAAKERHIRELDQALAHNHDAAERLEDNVQSCGQTAHDATLRAEQEAQRADRLDAERAQLSTRLNVCASALTTARSAEQTALDQRDQAAAQRDAADAALTRCERTPRLRWPRFIER